MCKPRLAHTPTLTKPLVKNKIFPPSPNQKHRAPPTNHVPPAILVTEQTKIDTSPHYLAVFVLVSCEQVDNLLDLFSLNVSVCRCEGVTYAGLQMPAQNTTFQCFQGGAGGAYLIEDVGTVAPFLNHFAYT